MNLLQRFPPKRNDGNTNTSVNFGDTSDLPNADVFLWNSASVKRADVKHRYYSELPHAQDVVHDGKYLEQNNKEA